MNTDNYIPGPDEHFISKAGTFCKMLDNGQYIDYEIAAHHLILLYASYGIYTAERAATKEEILKQATIQEK